MWEHRLGGQAEEVAQGVAQIGQQWSRSMEREGEYTAVYGLSLPVTRSASSVAAAMELVMPQAPNPVATYKSGVWGLKAPT